MIPWSPWWSGKDMTSCRVQGYAETLEPGLRQRSSSPRSRDPHCCWSSCLSRPYVVIHHRLLLGQGCVAALCRPDWSQQGLALEDCSVLSYLVTMTRCETAAGLLPFLVTRSQMAFVFLAISHVRPGLVCLGGCTRQPGSRMGWLNALRHSACHVSLNPRGIFHI